MVWLQDTYLNVLEYTDFNLIENLWKDLNIKDLIEALMQSEKIYKEEWETEKKDFPTQSCKNELLQYTE